MFSKELSDVIIGVLTSWQVLLATVGIIIYSVIVSYVAQIYRVARPKRPKKPRVKKMKKPKKPSEPDAEISDDDDLGISE